MCVCVCVRVNVCLNCLDYGQKGDKVRVWGLGLVLSGNCASVHAGSSFYAEVGLCAYRASAGVGRGTGGGPLAPVH